MTASVIASRRHLAGPSRRENLRDAQYWDERAERPGLGAVMWPNEAFNQCVDRIQRQTLLELLGDVSGHRMLDVGCGQGRLSLFLAEQGAHVTGIDFSGAMIARAAAAAARQQWRGSARFLEASLDGLRSVGDRFDDVISVCCLCMLETAEPLRQAIEALSDLVPEGGRVVLMEPIHRWWPLRRVCALPLMAWVKEFERAGFVERWRSGMIFVPVKILCGLLPVPAAVTRSLFRGGEALLRLPALGPVLADYKILLFQRSASTRRARSPMSGVTDGPVPCGTSD